MNLRDVKTCPSCGEEGMTGTYDTRSGPCGVTRRRFCGACDKRWTTIEIDVSTLKLLIPDLETPLWSKKRCPASERARFRSSRRRMARHEAAATGEDVRAIYERWGVA